MSADIARPELAEHLAHAVRGMYDRRMQSVVAAIEQAIAYVGDDEGMLHRLLVDAKTLALHASTSLGA